MSFLIFVSSGGCTVRNPGSRSLDSSMGSLGFTLSPNVASKTVLNGKSVSIVALVPDSRRRNLVGCTCP